MDRRQILNFILLELTLNKMAYERMFEVDDRPSKIRDDLKKFEASIRWVQEEVEMMNQQEFPQQFETLP